MLNITLLYFVILGLYHLGRKYLPKIQTMIQTISRMMKEHPFILLGATLSCLLALSPEHHSMGEQILNIGRGVDLINPLTEDFERTLHGSEMETLIYQILMILFAV
jgi:hypothetical protein